MSDKKKLSNILLVVGIVSIVLVLVGYYSIGMKGLTGDQFDALYKVGSYLGANYASSKDAFQILCARYRLLFLVVGIASFIISAYLRSQLKTASDQMPTATSEGPVAINAWVTLDGSRYYYGADGKPVTNAWVEFDGNTYFMGADGKIVTDSWVEQEGKWFYVNESGNPLKSQWLEWEWCDTRYYLDESGVCTQTEAIQPKDVFPENTSEDDIVNND